ncbi:hypothetical protein KEJ24_07165 [Candidatus Bathyarchaeota archaeon]|nr:hypothetical protein [Candidatus Bathyarchaeota archaeon]
MNFFTYVAMAIGGAIGGVLCEKFSPQLPFLLAAVLASPSIILILFLIREPKPQKRET